EFSERGGATGAVEHIDLAGAVRIVARGKRINCSGGAEAGGSDGNAARMLQFGFARQLRGLPRHRDRIDSASGVGYDHASAGGVDVLGRDQRGGLENGSLV